ncbi:MAG: hypothetical protein GX577_09165 [Leptolinea sp.]|nr:hypothetical protein [Leptolinea sp.]
MGAIERFVGSLNLPSFLIHIGVTASLAIQSLLIPIINRPVSADWCQCVIFVLTILGIDQIPGEYWTAASLAVPDANGQTWMDYQGYTLRPSSKMPQTGDLLVLAGGAQVVTVQERNSMEHLVPVPVDVWAGHIGIILGAEEVEYESTAYYKIHLLSTNWGVNSKYLGVVGSCYNADESEFLIVKGDKKANFFYETDPQKMRERLVNRAERWARLGLMETTGVTMDGFSVTPTGFISHVLRPVGDEPLIPPIRNIQNELIPIEPQSLIPGDIVQIGEETDPGFGVIIDPGSVTVTRTWTGSLVYFEPDTRVSAPDQKTARLIGNEWVEADEEGVSQKIKFLRYTGLPGYLLIPSQEPPQINLMGGKTRFELTLGNGGGQPLTVSLLSVDFFRLSEGLEVASEKPARYVLQTDDVVFGVGEYRRFNTEINPVKPGSYRVLINYSAQGDEPNTAGEILLTVE